MLTREDLAKLARPASTVGGLDLGGWHVRTLSEASPALALACLDALAAAVDLGLDDLADTLNLALVDAGVEDPLVGEAMVAGSAEQAERQPLMSRLPSIVFWRPRESETNPGESVQPAQAVAEADE